ncbi:MAG: hypothetical protein R6V83_00795 [Candidatus Thorarchaeota archaeon]
MGEKEKSNVAENGLREDIAQELAMWRSESSTLIPDFFIKHPDERFDFQDFMERATIEGSRLINGEKRKI